MMSNQIRPRSLALALALVLSLLAAPVLEAHQSACKGYSKNKRIEKLGGPNAFAAPVNTVSELQERIETHRPEVEHVLEEAGIAPEHILAFFEAVKDVKNVEEGLIQKGDKFDWMAFRWKGKAKIAENLCFTIKDPEPSFIVKVPRTDRLIDETVTETETHVVTARTYEAVVFDIPKKCTNISVRTGSTGTATISTKEEVEAPPAPAPVAQLTADRDCEKGTWSLGTAGSVGELALTATNVETGESKTIPLTEGSFSGADSAALQDYRFSLTATNADGVSATAETAVAGCPKADLTLGPLAVLSGAPITAEIDGNWAPDGLDVGVFDLDGNKVLEIPTGAAPISEIIRIGQAGLYTARGTAKNEDGVTATVGPVEFEVEPRLALRGFAAFGNPTSDDFFASNQRTPTLQERQKFALSDGTGFGASLEYLLTRRVGIEGGILLLPFDSMFTLDLNDAWGMQNQDVDWTAFTAGVNFHLTPDARGDVYVGPFLAFGSYDDTTYNVLGETYNLDFDGGTDFGLQLGYDYPFSEGSPLHFHAGARYLPSSSVEVKGALQDFEIDVDPTILSLGLTYKF
ncbi:MAG: outer membrane beta-barrel protein [Acidobacteriota bacterium]